MLGLALIGPRNVWSIIFPHVTAPTTDYLKGEGYTINTRLRAAVPILLLAAVGAVFTIYRRNWLALYPLAWAVLAYLSFSLYSPVFYHHQLMVTIPAAMLAAAAVGEGILSLVRLRRSSDLMHLPTLLGAVALIGFVFVSVTYWQVLDRELMDSPRISDFTLRATSGKLRVLRAMDEHIDQTNWIMTDMPMYAFRVGKPVPPNLATFSSKRLATGALTDDIIVRVAQEQTEVFYRQDKSVIVLQVLFECRDLETRHEHLLRLVLMHSNQDVIIGQSAGCQPLA
ncbi:MAG TPA: hypothetical protein VHP14_02855, partial [Anaerolineales bacterium]|nr:hypothetical protein [Anaerolineales bacterium]